MNADWAIETDRLCKAFPRRPLWGLASLFGRAGKQRDKIAALVDVNLRARRGELLVLLGPNGAGKTTLIKVLSTLILPDSGEALIDGNPLKNDLAVKRSIGLVTGNERSFFWRLSVRANLQFFAAVHNLSPSRARSRIRMLSDLLGLDDYLSRRFDGLPSGIKQRVSLARGLLHDPAILFLDEPTKSLDPLAARDFRVVVSRLVHEEGHTVIWVTHHLDEAEELGGRIAIMKEGRLRVAESISHLREEYGGETPPPSSEEIFKRYLQEIDRTDSHAGESVEEKRQKICYQPGKRDQLPWWLKAAAFIKRDFLARASYRFAFILQLLGILFSISIFFFIASVFGPSAAPLLKDYGGRYFPFVLIGLAFSGYLHVALSSFSSAIRQGQITGTLEAILVSPTKLITILLCSGLWNFLFTSLRVILYLVLGALVFGVDFSRANIPAALLVQFLTILSFASLGIISASFVIVFKKGDPLAMALGSASALLGGVYYPIGVLPSLLQNISSFLPITYSLRAMRLALLQGYSIPALIREIAVLSLFAAVLCPLSAWIFKIAVRRAKKAGSLAQY